MSLPPPRLILAGAILAGCRGGPQADPTDTGASPPTPTTATFLPQAFGVTEARFQLQEDGRIGPTPDGSWSLTVQLLAANGDRCDAVFMGTAAMPQPVLAGADGVLAAAMRPEGPPTGSCEGADLPVDWADPMGILDAWDFAVGITDAPAQDLLDGMDPEEVEALGPYLFGGGVYLDGVDGDGDGTPDQEPWREVAIAWCEADSGDLIPSADQRSEGALLPGTYVVQPQRLLTPARALLRPPTP